MPRLTVGELVAFLTLDSKNYNENMTKAEKDTAKLVGVNEKLYKGALYAGTALATIGEEALRTANKAAEYADTLKDLSEVTGLTTTQLQKLRAAGTETGVNFNSITLAVRMMTQNMKEMRDPSTEVGKTLKDLGYSATDANGRLKSTYDNLWDLFKVLEEMPNINERNRVAMQIFGRQYSELIPLIKEYKSAQEAAAATQGISPADIKAAEEYKKSIDKLMQSFEDMQIKTGTRFIPALQSIADWINNVGIPTWNAFLNKVEYFGYVAGSVLQLKTGTEMFTEAEYYSQKELMGSLGVTEPETSEDITETPDWVTAYRQKTTTGGSSGTTSSGSGTGSGTASSKTLKLPSITELNAALKSGMITALEYKDILEDVNIQGKLHVLEIEDLKSSYIDAVDKVDDYKKALEKAQKTGIADDIEKATRNLESAERAAEKLAIQLQQGGIAASSIATSSMVGSAGGRNAIVGFDQKTGAPIYSANPYAMNESGYGSRGFNPNGTEYTGPAEYSGYTTPSMPSIDYGGRYEYKRFIGENRTDQYGQEYTVYIDHSTGEMLTTSQYAELKNTVEANISAQEASAAKAAVAATEAAKVQAAQAEQYASSLSYTSSGALQAKYGIGNVSDAYGGLTINLTMDGKLISQTVVENLQELGVNT